MTTYTTYDQVGLAEDVSDIITDIGNGVLVGQPTWQTVWIQGTSLADNPERSPGIAGERATTIPLGVEPSGSKRTAPHYEGEDIVSSCRRLQAGK